MAQPKRILVACGTAIATSTVVAKAIEEEMKKRGIPVIHPPMQGRRSKRPCTGVRPDCDHHPCAERPGSAGDSDPGVPDRNWKGGCSKPNSKSFMNSIGSKYTNKESVKWMLLVAISALFNNLGATVILPIIIFFLALILGAKPAGHFAPRSPLVSPSSVSTWSSA